jgi:hypothetical protein
MRGYDYPPEIWAEFERALRLFFPANTRIKKAPLGTDWAGIDALYYVNYRCPVALRWRRDRPANASMIDITLRSTEPAKIAAGTYAPILIVIWTVENMTVATRGIDVYRMASHVQPPLAARSCQDNGDGTSFLTVGILELYACDAILRHGDRNAWVTVPLDGMARIERIMTEWAERGQTIPPKF